MVRLFDEGRLFYSMDLNDNKVYARQFRWLWKILAWKSTWVVEFITSKVKGLNEVFYSRGFI